MNIISFANINYSPQSAGEIIDLPLDKELNEGDFSALLSAFCAAPQLPVQRVEVLPEQLSEKFESEQFANANEFSKLPKSETLLFDTPVVGKQSGAIEFELTEQSAKQIAEKIVNPIFGADKIDFPPEKFEAETKTAILNRSLDSRSINPAISIQIVKNEKSDLPSRQIFNLPIDLSEAPKEITAKQRGDEFSPLQKIFQSITRLPNDNFTLKNPDFQNLVESNFEQPNQIWQKEVQLNSGSPDFVEQNSNQGILAERSPVQSSLIEQNLAAENLTQQKLAATNYQTPMDAPVKPLTKIDENNLLETPINIGIVIDQKQSLSAQKQTVKTAEINLPIDSFDQIGAAILELSNQINSPKQPQIITLRLRPAELGTVEIKLEQTTAGKISARLITSLESTNHIFNENIFQLKDALKDAGWQIEHLELSCASFQNTAGSGSNGNQTSSSAEQGTKHDFSFSGSLSETEKIRPTDSNPPQSNRLLSVRA